ncbi:unnamed protein product [Heterobilharzia americana]|nr:unnamed protein product [Heterobilharzia americana]
MSSVLKDSGNSVSVAAMERYDGLVQFVGCRLLLSILTTKFTSSLQQRTTYLQARRGLSTARLYFKLFVGFHVMDIPLKSSGDEPGVLKEIDCYISPAMQRQILLLLYKNRENYRTLDSESIKDVRINQTLTLSSSISGMDGVLLLNLPVIRHECHFVPLNRDVLVLDTLKESIRVDRISQNSDPSASSNVAPAAFVSARLRTADANALRGPMASRRKPADSDPDVIFLRQQTQAPWRPVRYKRYIPSEAFERRIPLLYPNDDMVEPTRGRTMGPSQEEYVDNFLASVTPTLLIKLVWSL